MKKQYVVDQEKAITGGIVSIFCLVIATVLIIEGRLGSAVVFGIISAVFALVAAVNGALICMDEDGLCKRVCGFTVRRFQWNEIAEAGVCGTNPFNEKRFKKAGRLYIYCSAKKLDEKERYSMILKWPPKSSEQLYFIYDAKRLEVLRLLWSGRLEAYNTGTLLL